MKKMTFLLLILLSSNLIFAQSLMIYKTDQTSMSFDLSEIDSITFSVTALSKTLDLSGWKCLTIEPVTKEIRPATGVLEEVAEGLKIFGSGNQITNSIHLASVSDNPITDKSVYLKWKMEDMGNLMSVVIDLYTDTTNWTDGCRITNFTTGYSTEGQSVISNDTWYFTRITVTTNTAVSTTSTDDYDIDGGVVIQESLINLSEPVKTFTFGAKANPASYLLLGEVRIE
ncbi:MAG: hypothetical protein PHW79_00225 [Candidatus Marinimicrobia bacterium]|nr:hypothetical protein [Candidatus Neomarinimicrobiota bacterium]